MRLFLLIVFNLTCLFSFAQTTILKGKIMDGNDNFSLPGATLKISDGNRFTVSDVNGNFEFLNLPAGTYTLTVDYLGYAHYSETVTVRPGQDAIEVLLSSSSRSIDEVHVMGDLARGQAKALNQQKNNSNISNIISSDQVGRFPDQNIGDALKRVPGITMQNDQGEARNIIIRGLSPELNSVTLNGDRIPSAEGDNRNVQMDLIPSDMISTIEVNKTLTPDMDADAIGGSVNLITRPVPNKQRISATLGGGYSPVREKGIYNGSVIYGNRFMDNKMGLVLSGTLQSNDFGSNNIESEWKKDDKGNVFMKDMQIRKYDVHRIRRSVSAAWDFDFNTRNKIALNAMYNWRDDLENRFAVSYKDMEWNADENAYIGKLTHQTKGGISNDKNKGKRLERQDVLKLSMKGEHLLTSKLDFDWTASYSRAAEHRPNERYISYDLKKVGFGQDLSSTYLPFVNDPHTDYAKLKFNKITENENKTNEDEFGAKVNLRFPFSVISGQKGRLRVGARIRLKSKERNNNFFEYKPTDKFGDMTTHPLQVWDAKHWDQGERYAAGGFVSKDYLGQLDLYDNSKFTPKDKPDEYLAKNYHAKERIVAEYLRWDQNITKRTAVILGLRIEHTSIDYTGNNVLEEEELIGEIRNKNSYTNFLPSINVKHNFNNNFILRAAVTTGLARPNYYALAPYVNTISEDKKLFAGNPNLKSTNATNFDLMLENYFQNVGIISGGVFYKNLKNFIYMYNDQSFNTQGFSKAFPDLKNPIAAGETWKFTQFRNGEEVDVYGFEVAFQRQLDFLPGKFLKGFGIYTNYTYTGSKAKGIAGEDGVLREGLGLPRTTPHMFNGSLSWENNKFSARVSANYTAAYLDEIGKNAFTDAYYDKQFFLDANASYKVTKQFRIFAEANNLTNQPLRYYQGQENLMQQLEYYKPRYNLGIKFDL